MLSPRTETILKSIVGQYIANAIPVPSQSIVHEYGLQVSSATIRNEMARLEQGGYIIRPHTSAGSVPSDMGYRYYVELLEDIKLPPAQQRMISHLFHQVESKLDEWLSLTAALLAHLSNNLAVVATPKTARCQFKHVELVSLRETSALLVLVLQGAKVRQQLVTLDQTTTQVELAEISRKLNAACSGLTTEQISGGEEPSSTVERQFADCVLAIMRDEDGEDREEPHLDGLHLVLEQPEFTDSRHVQTLVELTEQKRLLRSILPRRLPGQGVKVVIGRENEVDAIREYSVVVSHYGLPDEAVGTLAIIGPTRMPYARTIAAIDYMSWLLSRLVATLYGKEDSGSQDAEYQWTTEESTQDGVPREHGG